MARVVALTADLLFGSRIEGDLTAAGNDVELIPDEARLRARLTEADKPAVDVLVVDLVDEDLQGAALVESLATEGMLGQHAHAGLLFARGYSGARACRAGGL